MIKLIAPMLCHEYQGPRSVYGWGDILAQPKYDGMRVRLARVNGVKFARSRPSRNLPDGSDYTAHLEHLLDALPNDYDNYMADAELFTGTWGQTMTLARKLSLPPEERRKLHALLFDFVDLEEVDRLGHDPTSLMVRQSIVNKVAEQSGGLLHPVESRLIKSQGELDIYYREVLEQGQEGLILKNLNSSYCPKRSNLWLKLKPTATAEGTVVGFEPGEGKHEGRLGACTILLDDGTKVNCGGGYRDHEREYVWKHRAVFNNLRLEFKFQPDPDIKARFLRFKRFRWDQTDVQPPVGYKGR